MATMRGLAREGITNFAYTPGESDPSESLTITNVLILVFKRLPFKELRLARLVCRSWNAVISNYTPFGHLCQVTVRNNIEGTLETLTRAEFKIWNTFKFSSPEMDNSTRAEATFWISIGPKINSISLVNHSLTSVELLTLLSACPNLSQLTLTCRPIYGYQVWKNSRGEIRRQSILPSVRLVDNIGYMRAKGFLSGIKQLKILDSNCLPYGVLSDFLNLTGNLEALTLYDNGSNTIPNWDAGDVIRFVAAHAAQLRRLELTGANIYPEYISALSTIRGLNLSSLHLRYAKLTDPLILTLLKSQKNLVELDLSFTPCSQRAFTHLLCTFQSLKRLFLRGFSSNLTSLAFLSRMPVLEELDLSSSHSVTLNWELLIGALLPIRPKRLKSLNLGFNLTLGCSPKARLFSSFIGSMANITCLNLSQNPFLKDSFCHDIWRQMKFLRVVFLEHVTGISTEGITGIRHSQMQGLLANGSLGKIVPESLRAHNSGGSYIGICPCIEVLSLAYNARINDFALIFGVKDLERLQKLKLTGCSQITEEYLAELINSCPKLEYLEITGTQIPGDWADWAKTVNLHLRVHAYSTHIPTDARRTYLPTPNIINPMLSGAGNVADASFLKSLYQYQQWPVSQPECGDSLPTEVSDQKHRSNLTNYTKPNSRGDQQSLALDQTASFPGSGRLLKKNLAETSNLKVKARKSYIPIRLPNSRYPVIKSKFQ